MISMGLSCHFSRENQSIDGEILDPFFSLEAQKMIAILLGCLKTPPSQLGSAEIQFAGAQDEADVSRREKRDLQRFFIAQDLVTWWAKKIGKTPGKNCRTDRLTDRPNKQTDKQQIRSPHFDLASN